MRVFPFRDRLVSWAALAATAALSATSFACGKSSEEVTGLSPDGGLPDGGGGAGTVKELTLLLTGKVGGSLEPCG
ncbi:MAG: hypothetical protein JRI68_24985 [Deltaproteobacteria bacterium]|nr:hypothetical protein [Deltaproteobacteria bacterium]